MPTNKLEIYRGESLHLTVDIDERTQFSHTLNAEHKITAVFVSSERLDLQTEDYIIHNGERYSMNLPPSYRKSAKITYLYTCEFEHIFYKTHNKLFMHLGSADFSFFGDATAHMQLVVDNLNEISPSGWTLGAMASTEPRLITYVNNEQGFSCRNAIALIAETFELEIYYDGQQIGLVERVGVNTNISFEYGRGDGMYALSRLTPDNYLPANKIYVFGGKTNIPHDYRGGTKRLVFEDRFVTRPLEPGEPVIEGVRFYDDIYPERTSSFESVAGDGLLLTDSTIDFDINDHLIAGVTAMVVFKSGHLMGNEFEIESYDHTTKTIKIIQDVDENGYILPNDVVQPEAGDLYTLTGISLPQSYVDAAEIRLKERGDHDISQPERLPYAIEIDEKFMRDNGLSLNVGDRVLIKDDELDIDDTIRMSSIQYPLVNPNKITAEISDKVLYTKVDRVIKDQKRENDIIIRKQTQDYDAIRRNMLRFKQMYDLVFDPDGYFDPERIKPFSIETYLLSVGAQSQNFGLNGVTISTNHLGDENTLLISAGDLVHYTLEIEGLGYIWSMPQEQFSGLDPLKSYYVYAQCSRTVLSGDWMISETPVLAEDPLYPGMWNFNLGILFDVKEGRRDFEFTKGMTFIVGDTIKTGRVQDHSGNSYLDLDTGQFKIGNNERGMDWDVTRAGYLTIRGGIAVSPSGVTDYMPVYRGNWSSSVPYFRGDTVKWTDGNVYKWISEAYDGVSNFPPPNPLYWRLTTEKGEDGGFTELRFNKNGSPTSPPTLSPTNPTPPGWTLTMPTITPPLEFMWMTKAEKHPDGTLNGTWGTPVRVSGVDGQDGAPGAKGAFISPRGVYDPTATYQGTPELINAVTYLGNYYISRQDAPVDSWSGILPTNTNYWTPVDGQFEMIATGLLLATLAYIENLGVRYLQTDSPGNKRVEINGDENNVRIISASNQTLIELDDDSAQDMAIFQITFNTYIPGSLFVDYDNNYSSYNSNFVSTNNPAWSHGDFTNGFPSKWTRQYTQSGSNYTYYFYYGTAGVMVGGSGGSSLFPITTIGESASFINNLFNFGALGTGMVNTNFNSVIGLDGGISPDYDIVISSSVASSVPLPAWVTGSTINQGVLARCPFGREVRIANVGTAVCTVTAPTSILRKRTTDSSSISIPAGKTYIFKVMSSINSPISVSSFRWMVIGIMDN